MLIRDAAYDMLPRTRRQELHADLARYLEQEARRRAKPSRRWLGTGGRRARVTALSLLPGGSRGGGAGMGDGAGATAIQGGARPRRGGRRGNAARHRRRLALVYQMHFHFDPIEQAPGA